MRKISAKLSLDRSGLRGRRIRENRPFMTIVQTPSLRPVSTYLGLLMMIPQALEGPVNFLAGEAIFQKSASYCDGLLIHCVEPNRLNMRSSNTTISI